jgi:hypothetical protein
MLLRHTYIGLTTTGDCSWVLGGTGDQWGLPGRLVGEPSCWKGLKGLCTPLLPLLLHGHCCERGSQLPGVPPALLVKAPVAAGTVPSLPGVWPRWLPAAAAAAGGGVAAPPAALCA